MNLIKKIKRLADQCWALGFVRGGIEKVMETDQLEVDWVKMPEDCWMADPFVLDVTEDEILLLVEEMPYPVHKGLITLLHINRATMEITSRKVILEQPTHLSFPAIWRKDGHVYVYPESAQSGRLDMYEYDAEKEELAFVKTICADVVWDSYITEVFGEPLMFTAAHNDRVLDIYKLEESKELFVPYMQIPSIKRNSRLGGAVFEYKGAYYYPAQDCSTSYGGAIDIKRIVESRESRVERFSVETMKHIESPNKRYPLGLHTLNEYKGVVVVDAKGYRYGKLGAVMIKFGKCIKLLKK